MAGLIPLDYADGDLGLKGWLAVPEGDGPHPAVLVMHNAMGLGEQVKARAERLAKLGYVALAHDMYGDGQRFGSQAEVGPHITPLMESADALRGRCMAGLAALTERPEVDVARVAAIGFCFGGQCVLELARAGADLKAAVSYHGLLTTQAPAQAGAVKGEVAVFTGAKDPFAPAEHVEALRAEMDAADARWNITVFSQGYHAFTDPDAADLKMDGLRYDPLLDAMSWSSTLALLDTTLN